MNDFEIENGVLLQYRGQEAHVLVPEGVTSIGNYAFRKQKRLKTILFPRTLTSVGYRAFWKCRNLKWLVFPDAVTVITEEAFQHCQNLKSVTLEGTEMNIGKNAFRDCYKLKTLTISGKVRTIECDAFYSSYSLECICISEKIKTMGDYVFRTLPSLHRIVWRGAEFNVRNLYHKEYAVRKILMNGMPKFLIEEEKTDLLQNALQSVDFIPKNEIDDLIQYAIDKKAYEIQIMLMHYKNNNIGYESQEEIIRRKFSL